MIVQAGARFQSVVGWFGIRGFETLSRVDQPSKVLQEDLRETPRKRKTPPTPFQTETRPKRASVAMIINQPIN